MINAISYIISGLVVGVLAKLFYIGNTDIGFFKTTLIGILGSLLAGFVTSRGQQSFSRGGWIASIIGSMVLIFAGKHLGVL
ncbi:GlsB/YeaQ/YmgE family stress response membrane protein [Novosphingobium sp. TH158]|uniref:GlsB/YeaQ/YmgE family stress response membrane protein n=1 Tax=Novosphingobium sp. TH158 TaxID=2067455 RepID=UPI000C7A439B|nr:GlsB/YeaQ/YmgE family stress response membrane protein [Novosphingobium sp. TH158]PLK26926.1 GlsB/YeaQ/YmgE family stress response membrane protein [Novosphingobium sp. TH158]